MVGRGVASIAQPGGPDAPDFIDEEAAADTVSEGPSDADDSDDGLSDDDSGDGGGPGDDRPAVEDPAAGGDVAGGEDSDGPGGAGSAGSAAGEGEGEGEEGAGARPADPPPEVPDRPDRFSDGDVSLDMLRSRTWGAFRMTPRQPGSTQGGRFGAWQVRCPFHKKNNSSGC